MVWAAILAIVVTTLLRTVPAPPDARVAVASLLAVVCGVLARGIRHPRVWPDRAGPPPLGLLASLALVAPAAFFVLAVPVMGRLTGAMLPLSVVVGRWAAEAAAALAIMPFVMVNSARLPGWVTGRAPSRQPPASLSAAHPGVWVAVTAVMAAFSIADAHPALFDFRTSYLLLLPIAWMALRGGLRGAVGAILIGNIVYVVVVHAVGRGTTLNYQTFLVGVNLAGLLIGAIAQARSEVQHQLSERDQMYRLIAENSTDVILVVSADGICRYVSPSVESLCGFQADQVAGRSLLASARRVAGAGDGKPGR